MGGGQTEEAERGGSSEVEGLGVEEEEEERGRPWSVETVGKVVGGQTGGGDGGVSVAQGISSKSNMMVTSVVHLG